MKALLHRASLLLVAITLVGASSAAAADGAPPDDKNNAPAVTVPGDMTVEATSAAGALVTFNASAKDDEDGDVPVACNPSSGSAFPIGTTTVTCTAEDSEGKVGTASFTVVVSDTTGPTITVPGPITATAQSSAGTTVEFSPSATDAVDGAVAVTCTPASGSTFPIGQTQVTCTAQDSRGNQTSATFTVTVTEGQPPPPPPANTTPTVTVPPTQVAEAAGPTGANVNFTPFPAAQDAEDGPLPVSCTATSGSLFPLGTTTVTCTATDSGGLQSTASFDVVVRDTTAPVVTPPSDITVISATPVPRDDPRIALFRSRASAADLVSTPVVTDDAPAVFPLGRTVVTFRAVDAAGNAESVRAVVTVVPPPAPGQPAPPTPPPAVREPPGNVLDLRARPLDRGVRLEWRAGPSAIRYVVTRSVRGGTPAPVYDGRATRYTDRGLTNGVEYRYVVISYNAAGLRSVGVAIVVVPARPMLLAPRHNAVLRKRPTLDWRAVPGAAYYNVQLFRVNTRALAQAAQRKILSAWPLATKLRVKTSWRFGGRAQRLAPGVYEWYVWPGYGQRSAKRYGPLIGWSRFTIRAPARRP